VKKKATSLFLLELILAMLIFFMAAAICVSMFAKAHEMNKKSQELNSAVLVEKNLAEMLSRAVSVDDACRLVTQLYPHAEISAPVKDTGSGITEVRIALDDDFLETTGQSAYQLTADLSEDRDLLTAGLHVYPADDTENGTSVYDLTVENSLSSNVSASAGNISDVSASAGNTSDVSASAVNTSDPLKSGTEEAAS
jgi:type II secretory pathway pseudopilin PulG